MARLPGGQWSAPSAISPNNMSAGLMLGFDIYDVVLLINTEKALESFRTHSELARFRPHVCVRVCAWEGEN